MGQRVGLHIGARRGGLPAVGAASTQVSLRVRCSARTSGEAEWTEISVKNDYVSLK